MSCNRPHEREILRWARTPEGTKVWCRGKKHGSEWSRTLYPLWRKNKFYVVDDEWASLRRAEIDGEQLECFDEKDNMWHDGSLSYWAMDHDTPRDWRVKPKRAYEWKWIIRSKNGDFRLSVDYYRSKAEVEEKMCESEVFCKYEPSKREVK